MSSAYNSLVQSNPSRHSLVSLKLFFFICIPNHRFSFCYRTQIGSVFFILVLFELISFFFIFHTHRCYEVHLCFCRFACCWYAGQLDWLPSLLQTLISLFLLALAEVYIPIPTEDQVLWQEREIVAFYHFGVNTYTGMPFQSHSFTFLRQRVGWGWRGSQHLPARQVEHHPGTLLSSHSYPLVDRSHHEDWCQGAHSRRQAPWWFLVWRSPRPPCLAYTPTSSPTTLSPPPAGETAREMSSRSSLTLAATSVSPVCPPSCPRCHALFLPLPLGS